MYTCRRTAPAQGHGRRQHAVAFRVSAALIASVFVHAVLMSGMPFAPAGKRAAHEPPATFNVALIPVPESVERSQPETALAPLGTAGEPSPTREKLPLPGAKAQTPRASTRSKGIDLPRDDPVTTGTPVITHAPDTTYYAANQLDIFPALAAPLRLDYPARAVADDVRRSALVELQISETGIVHGVKLIEAQPSGYFEDEIRNAFLASRFTPAMRDERPVRSRVRVRVDFGAEAATR